MVAKNSPTAHRRKLDSLDDSADATGPATPYHPEGDSRADLFAQDGLPQSGYRASRRFDRKAMILACAVAYVLGALSAATIFLSLR
jgi:hypothetical protein